MKNLSKIIFLALCLVASVSCGKPKEGAINRCAKEFSIPKLAAYKFETLLSKEGLFDSPIYHFKLIEGDFKELEKTLRQSGYKEWKTGELSFDGISFGWKEEDLQYSQIKRNGSKYYVAISKERKEVVFVRYP